MSRLKAFLAGIVFLSMFTGSASGTSRPAFLYVAAVDGAVHSFGIDSTTGVLTPLSGSPFPLATFPRTLSIAASGPFAYIAGGFPGDLMGLDINPADGSLSSLPGFPTALSGVGPIAAAVDGRRRFLYIGNNVSQDISAYVIDRSSGQLTPIPGEPFPAIGVVGNGSLAADPLGRFLYLATGAITAALSVFQIDPATGALAHVPGSPFPADPGGNTIAADPSGRFVYVVNEQTTLLWAYAVDASGALVPVPGSPWPASPRPLAITVDPKGRFVFVGNFSAAISVFSIDGTTGAVAPVPGSPFSSGFQPNSLLVDRSGSVLYVADPQGFSPPPSGSGGVWAHLIDPSTGFLSLVPGAPFSAGMTPWALGILAPRRGESDRGPNQRRSKPPSTHRVMEGGQVGQQ